VLHLFEQHARDEIGHRAIVFDLLRNAGASGWLARAAALALVSVAAAFCVPRVLKALLKDSDGLSPRRRARAWAGVRHWFSPSLFLKGWCSYLRPHFHPRHLPDSLSTTGCGD
jgi:predicted metal-dependent hydrolase